MVLQTPSSGRATAAPSSSAIDYQRIDQPPALIWRYSLAIFLTGLAFTASIVACLGWASTETLVRFQIGSIAFESSTLVIVAAMLLLTAGFKMQSTQARLTHISLAFLNRPRERDGSGPDDDDGPYFSAVTRDDVPDSAAYYVAGSFTLLTVAFAVFHARSLVISVLAEQGLIISGIIAAIACLTPIIVLIATIGMVENAMRRLDVPGLLAPVMASCALFVAFMTVHLTHLAR